MKIAFGYKISSGKDICVKYLIEKYGGNKITFSEYLYKIMYFAQETCGFNLEKDRKFLQWIGTEWAREKDPNVWVNLTLKNCPTKGNIYCSDLRFINEFKALKNNGWTCIKLNRINNKNDERIGNGDSKHISEYELDILEDSEWDYIIYNNGNVKSLFDLLDNIVKKLKTK